MFDEPIGPRPGADGLLCGLIERMHAEHGGTYIVITHDVASMRRIGQYIAVLWKGGSFRPGSAARCSTRKTRSSASSSPAPRTARSEWSDREPDRSSCNGRPRAAVLVEHVATLLAGEPGAPAAAVVEHVGPGGALGNGGVEAALRVAFERAVAEVSSLLALRPAVPGRAAPAGVAACAAELRTLGVAYGDAETGTPLGSQCCAGSSTSA